ncbi:unnamed protein product [Schistocephalus solidus]|uniref:Secreted protein n=1 Tax=Schistocephalus solidus TaxID=70667 RepID=A0A183T1T4_SCHSO|nr:unnamed protein product [Schistocephalus solidus]
MRWLEVLLPLRLTFYLGSTSSVLLSLFLIQSCDISTTVTTLSDSRLTSRVRWTRGTSGEEEKKEEDVSVSGSLLQASFCLDSVGVKRGLFTRWIDSHGCECSCNPTGKVAVIICGESCSGAPTGLDRGKSEYPLERPETNLGHDNQKCEVVLRFFLPPVHFNCSIIAVNVQSFKSYQAPDSFTPVGNAAIR